MISALVRRWFTKKQRSVDPAIVAARDRLLHTYEQARHVLPDDQQQVAELEAEAAFVRRIAAGGSK